MPRSRQIFRTRASTISRCRGTLVSATTRARSGTARERRELFESYPRAASRRHVAGGFPTTRRKARLNAASLA